MKRILYTLGARTQFRINLIFMVLLALCALPTYAQTQKLSITANNMSIADIIKEVEKQSDYLFVFDKSEVKLDGKASFQLKDQSLKEIMDKALSGTDLTYAIEGKNVMLMKRTTNNQQGGRVVSGVIINASGESLPSVNVIIKGTSQGVMADMDGKYSITIPENISNPILRFAFLGYTEQELAVGSRGAINVVLVDEMSKLDEVVVVGYGTQKKRDLTGAISTIKTSKLAEEAPRSVQDLMRANSAGLSIGLPTDAKGAADLQIRGKNSLKASTSPLLVLDGVIYEGELSDINPMDIESIDVLKDASSAAVYGSKSANGVVMINTKRGKQGKPLINFNSNVGIVQVAKMQKVLGPEGFLDYRTDYEIGKKTDDYHTKYPEMFINPQKLTGASQLDWYNYDQKTPVTSVTDEQLTRTWLGRLELKTPEIENYLSGRITNWQDEVFQTGLQQDYTVSISNRTDNMVYYWSLGYVDREGIIKGDKYTNFRTRLNLESKISNWLTVGLNSGFSVRDESALKADWEQSVRLTPYSANDIGIEGSPYQRLPTGDVSSVNPFYDNLFRDRKTIYNNLNANLYARIKLPVGFQFQVNFIPRYTWYEYYNHDSAKNEDWKAKGGEATRETEKIYSWQVDNVLSWKKEFNDHNFEVTLLANAEKLQSWKQKMTATQFSPSDVLGWHAMQSGKVPIISSDDQYQTGDALMGRVFYSYKGKYMFTGSLRRDGYSAFGNSNPRATFPAVALGWILTSENFMEPVKNVLNYAKLRLSWGENGNRSIGRYEALSEMKPGSHPYIDQNGVVYISSQLFVNRMSNMNLKWERTSSFNVGLDFSVLNDVLSGSMEGYISTTNDLLVDRALPEIIGFASVAANLGKIRNHGFEVSLNANIMKTQNFSWNASANLSFNRRQIKELYGDFVDIVDANGNVVGSKEADDVKNKWFIGQDPDRIWDYENVGVWQVEEAEEAKKFGLQPGDFKYKDQDENGVMTDKDKTFQEYKTPRFRWTFRNEFYFYNKFSLSFMLYSNWGQYESFNRAANISNFPDRSSEYVQPHWTPANRSNDFARIGSKNTGSIWKARSFVRLDNITASYNLPKPLLNKISIQDMRVSVSVRNVMEVSPQWNFWDPESAAPTPRTFNLSVNLTL